MALFRLRFRKAVADYGGDTRERGDISMAIDTRSEILALEKRFWDSMKQKDGDKAGRMTSKRSIIVGAQGVSSIDPATMERLTVEGDWTIDSYEFDDASMQVEMIDEDTAATLTK